MNKDKTFNRYDYIFFIIIVIASVYLLIFKLPFPDVDDLILKQPGASLARGLGFVAPAVKGFYPGFEELFVHYPPVYPFLFGIWFSIFDFSLSSSLVLSLLICGSVIFIYTLLFKTILKKRFPLYIYGLIFFGWCTAVRATHRPDMLFVLLALSLLLIIKKASERMTFITQLSIIMLLGLSLATSFGLGVFFITYLFFVLISVQGLNLQTIKTFCIWIFFGVVLFVLIWWVPFRSNPSFPYFLKAQYIDGQILKNLGTHNFLKNIKEGFSSGLYATIYHIPLVIFLTIVFIANALLGKDKNERKFLNWQFLGIAIVLFLLSLRVPSKHTYMAVFLFFLVFICGIALVRVVESIKNLCLKRMLLFVTFFCLFIACSPVFRMVIFPLTWQKEDTYNYSKKVILHNIKKGSKVMTDVRFWYILNEDYEMYETHFAPFNIYNCSYVLLPSGGSGKPDLPVLQRINDEQRRYLYEHFTEQLNTLSDEPNKIFGFPISRSRWGYRFVLYKRR